MDVSQITPCMHSMSTLHIFQWSLENKFQIEESNEQHLENSTIMMRSIMSGECRRWDVGSTVRVVLPQTVSKAVISFDNGNGTYDIVKDNGVEVNGISSTCISALEDFELNKDSKVSAYERKEQGNVLFKLNDFGAAAEQYSAGLRVLVGKKLSVGMNVMICRDNKDIRLGMVSGLDERPDGTSTADIFYETDDYNDEDDNEEDEEDGIPIQRITPLAPTEHLELHRALCMNQAKCALKLGALGWSVRWSSFAVAISKHIITSSITSSSSDSRGKFEEGKIENEIETKRDETKSEERRQSSLVSDALYLRAKCLLTAARPKLAMQDVRVLSRLDAKKAAVMERDIDVFVTQRVKANKKLARDVAAWVDEAMRTAEQGQGQGKQQQQPGVQAGRQTESESEDSRVTGGLSWMF
eukprot:gene3777-7503_t